MQASPAEHQVYVWNPPGARQTVELRVEAVDQIAAWTLAGLETEGRGIETGGLLIGRTRRERGRTVVEVLEAELVECEHAAGPSWMLSNADRRAMEAQIRSRKGAVVGCFRSNTRREFTATVEDFGLLDSHFPLMLLVDARRGAPLRAGVVFRGDREMGAELPFTRESVRAVAVPPAPIPMVVPTPRKVQLRIPKTAWAAVAVVLGVTAGVWYEGEPRAPRPVEAKKPAPLVAKAEPPVTKVEAPPTVEVPAPTVEAPPPAVEPPPAPVQAPAAKPAPVASAPPAPVVTTAPRPQVVSADRAAPPASPARPTRRAFVPPPEVARAAPPRTETADLPTLQTPRLAAPAIVAGGAVPRPVAPAPAPKPAIEARVAVAVDPVPRSGRFVPPETLQGAPPHIVHVERTVVINVRVYVDRTGKVDYAELLSDGMGENRDLASAAVFSARKWRFSPAKVDGKAVPAQAVLRFRFLPETR
jgi:hypothetical protein